MRIFSNPFRRSASADHHLKDGDFKPANRPRICALLDRLFTYEGMSGNGACPVYLERWTVANFRRLGYGVYIHRFIGDDWALDPHDHPRRFISIGLWGWYWEDVFWRHTFSGQARAVQLAPVRHVAPWIRTFPANHLHRIRAKEHGNTWTLVIVCPKSRPWGFVQDGVWIPVKNYVFGGVSRKDC